MTYTPIQDGDTGLTARTIINAIGVDTDNHITATGSSVHGLGTISFQSASAVSITGGSGDNLVIGAGTPASGSFTALTGTSLNIAGIATITADGLAIASGTLAIIETTTPSSIADYGKIYTKSDNKLYFQDGAGTEHEVTLGASGGITYTVESISIDKTLGDSDCVMLVSGSPTISLPTAIGITGKGYHIKNVGTDTISVAAFGGQVIDGETSLSISSQYSSVQIVSDGSNWNII